MEDNMAKFITIVFVVFYMTFPTMIQAQESPTNKKILIAYLSWGGNTRSLAEQIHQVVGGDLFEIKTVEAYPTEYRPTTEVAKRELEANSRPAIAGRVNEIASYDIIFLGYPIWWETIPMPLCTFLEQYDFSGKTIIPFCTYGRGLRGSGLGRSADDIKKLCPGANVLDALVIFHFWSGNARGDIANWLLRVGVTQQ
jgi:flavodoxin